MAFEKICPAIRTEEVAKASNLLLNAAHDNGGIIRYNKEVGKDEEWRLMNLGAQILVENRIGQITSHNDEFFDFKLTIG